MMAGSWKDKQRQVQPQVLRLRGSQSAVSHFAQDDSVWVWRENGNGKGNRNGNGKDKDKDKDKC